MSNVHFVTRPASMSTVYALIAIALVLVVVGAIATAYCCPVLAYYANGVSSGCSVAGIALGILIAATPTTSITVSESDDGADDEEEETTDSLRA